VEVGGKGLCVAVAEGDAEGVFVGGATVGGATVGGAVVGASVATSALGVTGNGVGDVATTGASVPVTSVCTGTDTVIVAVVVAAVVKLLTSLVGNKTVIAVGVMPEAASSRPAICPEGVAT
jgi:hypothetical protein